MCVCAPWWGLWWCNCLLFSLCPVFLLSDEVWGQNQAAPGRWVSGKGVTLPLLITLLFLSRWCVYCGLCREDVRNNHTGNNSHVQHTHTRRVQHTHTHVTFNTNASRSTHTWQIIYLNTFISSFASYLHICFSPKRLIWYLLLNKNVDFCTNTEFFCDFF